MLIGEIESFYTNWNLKADRCDENTLEGAFDRFFTLFVIYNRLYALASYHLLETKKIPKPRFGFVPDKEGATSNVITFLGADVIVEIINLENNHKRYTDICSLIHNETFHIKLNRIDGKSQRKLDLILHASLVSDSNYKKANALLEVLYHVRCNMFHGHKSFEGVQKQLIDPLCEFMKSISSRLYIELKNL